jgi:hypothetical protein
MMSLSDSAMKKRAVSVTPVFLCVSEKWRSFSQRDLVTDHITFLLTIAPFGSLFPISFMAGSGRRQMTSVSDSKANTGTATAALTGSRYSRVMKNFSESEAAIAATMMAASARSPIT